jgi:hypothetical protein
MNRQSLIEGAADLLDRRQKLRQAFEREELALQRDDYSVCGGESVDGQKVERRRAINHDIGDGFKIVAAGFAIGP